MNEHGQLETAVGPGSILGRLRKINKPAYNLLILGMAVFAAAAIVAKWQKEFDLQLLALTGICIIGFAFFVSVMVWIIKNPQIRFVIGWFLTIVFLLWGASLTCATLLPNVVSFVPAPACHIYIFADACSKAQDRVARERKEDEDKINPVPKVVPVPLLETAFNPHDYHVSVYFAGVIDRNDVLKMTRTLEDDGWLLQKLPQQGGVMRTRGAVGYNEVRYNPSSPKNAAAATAVARLVQQANLTPVQIKPVPVTVMAPTSLEVWFSRP